MKNDTDLIDKCDELDKEIKEVFNVINKLELRNIRILLKNYSYKENLKLFDKVYIIITLFKKEFKHILKGNKRLKVCIASFVLTLVFINISLLANTDMLKNLLIFSSENITSIIKPKVINEEELENNFKEKSYNSFEDLENDLEMDFLKLKYLPTDFKLKDLIVSKNNSNIRINVLYSNDVDNIVYGLYINEESINTNSKVVEEINSSAEEYKFNDIEFLVFENKNWVSARWFYENIEYELHGFKSKQEILDIIKNITY